MYYTYVLKSEKDGKYYTGYTRDMKLRFEEHRKGRVESTKELALDGVFVEIGMLPNTDFVKGLVDLNERGEIKIDHKTAATSMPGIFAVGDATDALYKQNNISAGYGVTAALSAYDYLRKKE